MNGFHGNIMLQRMVDALIVQTGVTSFVETGTHYADTASHVAFGHPELQVFTCEIDEKYYAASVDNLQQYKHVRLFKESSEKFVARLVAENALGDLPMFFLDAHWYDYWPLPDEILAIAQLPKFLVLVDDFMVPGQPQFETSNGGGGTIGVHRTKQDNRPCSMDLIGPLLPHGCKSVYPAYGKKEAYGRTDVPHLVGHVFILKGISGIDDLQADPLYTWAEIRNG